MDKILFIYKNVLRTYLKKEKKTQLYVLKEGTYIPDWAITYFRHVITILLKILKWVQ